MKTKPKKKVQKVVRGWAVISKFGFYEAYHYKFGETKARVSAKEISEVGNKGKVIPCTITYTI